MAIELKDNFKIILDKGTQKVSCRKFNYKPFNRVLALHTNVDSKNISAVSDFTTGLKLCDVKQEISRVKEEDIKQALHIFTNHYGLEEILKRFKELDEERKKNGK